MEDKNLQKYLCLHELLVFTVKENLQWASDLKKKKNLSTMTLLIIVTT